MGGRYLLTIGSPRCPGLGLPELARVESDVRRVSGLLTTWPQEYQHVLTEELPIGSSSHQIRTALASWFTADARAEDDHIIVYVAGHGDSFGKFPDHCLLTADSLENREDTVIRTAELPRFFFAGKASPQNVLLMLDVCYAGQGAGESMIESMKLKREFPNGSGFWVIVSADKNTEAADGAFVTAWLDVMERDDAWLGEGGTQFLNPMDLTTAINSRLEGDSQQRVIPYVVGGPNEARFLINPRYTKKWDGLLVEEQAHWDPKARGVDTSEAPGWFFTGRTSALRELRAWLDAENSDGRARVVTGDPGSGKSAILGWLVLASEGRIPGVVVGAWHPLVSVHVRGARWKDVVSAVAHRLGSTASGAAALIKELCGADKIIRIIIDSLDEALEPAALEREFLGKLAACPSVRLIVGGRRRDRVAPLQGAGANIDLDDAKYFDPADVENYVFARLTSAGAGYANNERHPDARKIAKRVAARAGHSFLYARIVSRTLATDPVVDTSTEGWEERFVLPAGLTDAYAEDLERFDRTDRRRFRDLLIPLAYARGRGLPQKTIWAAIASHIAGQTYTNADIRDLKERAGYYLIQDTENRETVFRLFHQTFADYLKNITRDEAVEQSITQALMNLLRSGVGGVDPWTQVQEPYVLKEFASHAAAGGMLESALENAAFLINVPPTSLLPQLGTLSEGSMWRVIQAYRKTSHWLYNRGSTEGVRYLFLAALEYGALPLAKQLASHQVKQEPWWPLWTEWNASTVSSVVGETTNPISVLCAGWDRDYNLLAVLGCSNGTIEVRRVDNNTQYLLFQLTEGQPKDCVVTAVVTADGSDRRLIIAAWQNGAVRAIDQETGVVTGTWWRENTKSWRSLSALTTLPRDEAPDLVAIADEFDLVLLELPTLRVLKCRQKAVKGGIYWLKSIKWKDQSALLSTGDSVGDGDEEEAFPLRIWSLPDLAPIFAGAEGVRLIRNTQYVEISGKPCLISEESWRAIVCRTGETLEEVGSFGHDYATLIAAYVDQDKTLVLMNSGSRFVAYEGSASAADREGSPPFSIARVDFNKLSVSGDAAGGHWSEVVRVRERPVIMNSDVSRLRLWDLRDLLGPERISAEASKVDFRNDVLSTLTATNRLVIAGSTGGSLWAWTAAGDNAWSNSALRGAVSSLAIAKVCGNNELLAGTNDGQIYRFDLESGEILNRAFAAGSSILALDVHQFRGHETLFAAVNLRPQGREGLFCVRMWNLETDVEEISWHRKGERQGVVESATGLGDSEGDHPFPPALAMRDYLKTKILYGVSVFASENRTFVAIGGPHGEVQVMDPETLEEITSWTGGASGQYIQCLVGGLVDIGLCVFGGDETGTLFRGSGEPRISECIRLENAHRGYINALLLRLTPRGWVLVSGGNDGSIQFWTTAFERLLKMEVDRPVRGLGWFGDSGLAIGADRGLIALQIDWSEVFGSR
jgi:WD40 repeat protein